jgi:hypothetical protein
LEVISLKKFLIISVVLTLFISPVMAQSCYTQSFVRNVNSLSSNIRVTAKQLKPVKFDNYNWKLTAMLQIGKINATIKQASRLKPEKRLMKQFHILYMDALKSYAKAMEDMEHAIRGEDRSLVEDAQDHLKKGIEKFRELKRKLDGESV